MPWYFELINDDDDDDDDDDDLHIMVLQCWSKFSSVLIHWSIRMIHAKNYKTVFKFVNKVMPRNTVASIFPDAVYRWFTVLSVILSLLYYQSADTYFNIPWRVEGWVDLHQFIISDVIIYAKWIILQHLYRELNNPA